jgi:hypothetical protein
MAGAERAEDLGQENEGWDSVPSPEPQPPAHVPAGQEVMDVEGDCVQDKGGADASSPPLDGEEQRPSPLASSAMPDSTDRSPSPRKRARGASRASGGRLRRWRERRGPGRLSRWRRWLRRRTGRWRG